MSIPTGLARNKIAAHRLVSWPQILENSSYKVVNTRLTVGGGRTFEKHEPSAVLAFFYRPFKNLPVVPEAQYFFFDLFYVKIRHDENKNYPSSIVSRIPLW